MDAGTQAIARALDASIADVAAKEFHRISRGMSDQEIATATTHALDSLGRLQTGQRIPNYGEWDALFYLTWYQPRQINLAYTVARRIPKDQNPLLEGRGNLQVVDFGCGALAMQFGLALMAADTLENRGSYPRMAIVSTDSRDEMPRIGRQMWCRFVEEIDDARKYPELDALRQREPCDRLCRSDQPRCDTVAHRASCGLQGEFGTSCKESQLSSRESEAGHHRSVEPSKGRAMGLPCRARPPVCGSPQGLPNDP